MNSFLTEDLRGGAFLEKVPWKSFLFLIVVFFISQHEWFFSLNAGKLLPTADEVATRMDQGNILRRIVYFSMGVYAVVSFFGTRYRVKVEGALGWLMLLFLSWAFLSLTWSENPAISFRRFMLFCILSISAFAVSQRFSLRDIILWIFFSTLIYLHLGLAAELVLGTFYPLAEEYRFAGTLHPNSQGINCALLFFASFFLVIGQKRWRWVFIAVVCESLIFLFLTKSRTSLGFSLLALLLYWFMKGTLPRKGVLVLCFIFISCVLLLIENNFMPILRQIIILDRKDAEMITLTGRIPLWGQLLSYIVRRPIQGYGYDGFWTSRHIVEIASEQQWVVYQGHSVYLDLSLGLGVVGVVIYILMMIVGIRRTLAYHKISGNADYAFLGVVLIFFVLNGVLESIVIATNQVSFVLLWILASVGFSTQPRVKLGLGR